MSLQLNAEKKQEVITRLGNLLVKNYVFPEIAEKLQAMLHAKLQEGGYDSIEQPDELSHNLIKDLKEVHEDHHFNVFYDPEHCEKLAKKEEAGEDKEEEKQYHKELQERKKLINHGFPHLEYLQGRVGYLHLLGFTSPHIAGEAAVNAMNYFANAEALIVDLRTGGGGDPRMCQLLCSYFFDHPGREELTRLYSRTDDRTYQYWTLPYVPGPKLDKVDLYILTGCNTFSADEDFAHVLKNLKRATLIGETTGGGAQPGNHHVIEHGFYMFIPDSRAINPITKDNWEGTGVEPHIKMHEDDALAFAHCYALEKIIKRTEEDDLRKTYERMLEEVKVKYDPVKLEEKSVQEIVGKYSIGEFFEERGKIYYRRTKGKFPLIPLSQTRFYFAWWEYRSYGGLFQFEFCFSETGKTKLIAHYESGDTAEFYKE